MEEQEQKVEKEPNFFLWTVQTPRWRKIGRAGVKLVDTSVMTGIKVFAPHWHDLRAYKEGKLSEEEYTERYLEKMYDSQVYHKDAWNRLSVYPWVAYGCYCKPGEFCHRHLFKELAKTWLEGMGWTPKLMGEWDGTAPELNIPERVARTVPFVVPKKTVQSVVAEAQESA